MSVTSWFLVSSSGTRHRLPREMIFVGREDCELMLQSRSVDKQHAVINYDPTTDEHLVKDLGSLNGTFVNDLRIPDQTYITLKLSDVVRFGYDSHVYIMERSQHKVPEEALKHEKYTSQLQVGVNPLELGKAEQADEKNSTADLQHSRHDKSERKSNIGTINCPNEPPVFKPTPLYGQPSWWGEDEDHKGEHCESGSNHSNAEKQKEGSKQEANGPPSEQHGKTIYSNRRDANYFEITTKELLSRPKTTEQEVQVIPTKDTVNKVPSTPPVVQSHASFTIEFDDGTPGKIKIKDHVTKFSFRQRKHPSKESLGAPTEVMSSESKVADWLVQTDTSMISRHFQSDDLYTTKSDLSMNKNTLKDGHQHEDGTQSNSEDPVSNSPDVSREPPLQHLFTPPEKEEPPMTSTPRCQTQPKKDPKQAFVINLLDDDVPRGRSHSFTNNMSPAESHAALKRRTEKTKGAAQSGESLSSSAVQNTPTQRFTVPLKGSEGSQRGGMLRREKSDILGSTSNFSSRSASSKPFASVGRKSRMALDFMSEFLKVSKSSSTVKSGKSSSSTHSKASNMVSVRADNSTQSQPSAMDQTYVLSSSQHLEPSETLLPPTSTNCTVGKTPKGSRQEEEDTLSDTGTYTVDTEGPNKEVEEARNMIDQVFGVLECPEPSAETVFRSVEGDREAQDSLPLSKNSPGPTLGHNPGCSDPALGPAQERSMILTTGDSKWVSRWASLADSYSVSGPISGQVDISTQMDLSAVVPRSVHTRANESMGAEDSQTFRAQRFLPQLRPREEGQMQAPSVHVHSASNLTYDNVERNLQSSSRKDPQKLYVTDDLDPDSLSDASKSDDGSIIDQVRKSSAGKTGKNWSEVKAEASKQDLLANQNVKDQDTTTKFSTATITRQYGSRQSGDFSVSTSGKDALTSMENAVPLIRQESFTKHRSSDDIHFMKLPHISSPECINDTNAFKGVCSQDTQSYLKDTENALAVLETKLQMQKHSGPACPLEDSLSGESDVDTSSTVSQPSGQNSDVSAAKKPVILSHLLKGRKPASQHAQEQNTSGHPQSGKCRLSSRDNNYKESGKTSQSSTLHQSSDAVSDQESSSQPVHRKYTIPLRNESSRRSLKGTVSQVLARSGSLSAPKPTRTSMLRRTRLGDSSDKDSTETDRTSQNSDATSSSTRTQESKRLSRLDILALPRRRTSSFTTPSDSESSAGRTGFSNRSEAEPAYSARKASVPDIKNGTQRGSETTGRQPIIRGRSSSAKYASSTASSRRRQKGSDYASTSEEEYESNHSIAKNKRSHHSGALHSSRTQTPNQVRPPSRSRESEGEGHESDNFQNWTTHSAEIARLSQDLAKDLAILAQEIHNVAGDGETQNTASADAVEPVSAGKELRQQIPDPSINYSKVLQSSAVCRNPDLTVHDQGLKQRSWNQEQVALDNSMLNPVSQLSMAIRVNTEQLTEKIKLLFYNKTEVWEEIETMLDAADDSPPLESPNKEIMSIIRDLRGIQKRLEVINTVIEPSGNVNLIKSSPVLSHSTAGLSGFRASPRDSRATASQRAAGPSASARHYGRGNDGRVL
ncbi:centrosomal protein of 170 kDa protein B isoform X1 [Silurus meridionalis]|nr:centrosomal protein of 170 kDa protein B isoform X1 [Silurus meridionalis]